MHVPDKPTQVMSLDELMDLAAEPRDTVTQPIPATQPSPAAPMPAPLNPAAPPRPTGSAQTTQPAQPAQTEPDMRQRVMSDARRAYDAGLARGREWLKQGDNTLIALTAAVACLLLLVVAAL